LDRQQPFIQRLALLPVAPEALQFHAAPQFPHRHHRHEQGVAIGLGIVEEGLHAGIGPAPLAAFADDIGIDQVHVPAPRQ